MKTNPRMTVLLYDLLDLIADMAFLANRPSLQRLNRYWGYTEMRASYRAFQRWEAQEYLQRVPQGERILLQVGAKGKKLLQQRRPHSSARKRKWDGRWRMVVFDFPETSRKARDAFRNTLQRQRMGCLQKSVWITPEPIIPAWKLLLAEMELTEWVLLFESVELGPVDDVDIARKVWSLDELSARYERYLSEFRDLPRRLRSTRSSSLLGDLGRAARRESRAYLDLLQDDPMLPSAVVPAAFPGLKADEFHAEVRGALRECIFPTKK